MAPQQRMQIPGYYYDEEKGKYFKIEKTTSAPQGAAWSADSVKRRKIQHREAEAVAARRERLKRHIVRSAVLRDPLLGGVLDVELGLRRERRTRAHAGVAAEDVPAVAWAKGLVDKGEVPFVPSFARQSFPNIPCFYVGGDDVKTGLGVAYASELRPSSVGTASMLILVALDEETLIGSYIPTDENERISFSTDASSRPERRLSHRHEMIGCPQISSINYHPHSHRIIVTSREPSNTCDIYLFSPPKSAPNDDRPLWLLDRANHLAHISFNTGRREGVVNQTTPAPPSSSSLTCVIGTSYGLLKLTSDERIHWLGPARPRPGPVEGDFFDQSFLPSNPNVLLAGGRNRDVRMIDMRVKWSEWDSIPVGPVARLRAVNPHQFLTAGPRSRMALFDIRYRNRKPNGTRPVVEFPGYRNEPHMHIGWDVDVDSGVVAAAHDDGRVGVYSLLSGRRLRCSAVDAVVARTPVRSLQFQTMPGRRHPSLFAGVGPNLKMFSIGAPGADDEC
ncbi:myocyte-specific enhancer factor 2d [Colletotrichum incanum]|uniref:Myocyte-specific enhancer factor 2d n=1 Tax=Colletotrichum incanum TaxID=1573173 RepID=A0A161WNC6_COLIC|nr:myocyte-specific enhancer factor 2d [Colletotrichum incanum]